MHRRIVSAKLLCELQFKHTKVYSGSTLHIPSSIFDCLDIIAINFFAGGTLANSKVQQAISEIACILFISRRNRADNKYSD